jgi:hypothetical protein
VIPDVAIKSEIVNDTIIRKKEKGTNNMVYIYTVAISL